MHAVSTWLEQSLITVSTLLLAAQSIDKAVVLHSTPLDTPRLRRDHVRQSVLLVHNIVGPRKSTRVLAKRHSYSISYLLKFMINETRDFSAPDPSGHLPVMMRIEA
jgi:hypothetical protein